MKSYKVTVRAGYESFSTDIVAVSESEAAQIYIDRLISVAVRLSSQEEFDSNAVSQMFALKIVDENDEE